MGSPLAAASTAMRESAKLLRQQNMGYCVNAIARVWKRCGLRWTALERRVEIILDQNQQHQSPWTSEEIGLIMLQASHKVYGDPMQLEKHPLKLQPYTVLYYNTSEHHINVKPLGLKIETVVPGGLLSLPMGLTIGGRKSAVAGVAPQLQPCPTIEHDQLLDLTPSSFAEWVTYNSYQLSPCCNAQIMWSDTMQCLHCFTCMKEIKV